MRNRPVNLCMSVLMKAAARVRVIVINYVGLYDVTL